MQIAKRQLMQRSRTHKKPYKEPEIDKNEDSEIQTSGQKKLEKKS